MKKFKPKMVSANNLLIFDDSDLRKRSFSVTSREMEFREMIDDQFRKQMQYRIAADYKLSGKIVIDFKGSFCNEYSTNCGEMHADFVADIMDITLEIEE